MAQPLAAITGKVRFPDGNPAGLFGKIYMEISVKGVVDDDTDSSKYELLGTQEIDIDASGNVSFSITPNDLITPAGTFYKATYLVAAKSWEESIVVTGVGAKDLADLVRSTPASTVVPLAATPVATKPAATASNVGHLIYVTGDSPVGAYINLPTLSGGYDWQPFASGGF